MFLGYVCQLMNYTEDKKVSEEWIKTKEILKDVIIIKINRWISWCIWKTIKI